MFGKFSVASLGIKSPSILSCAIKVWGKGEMSILQLHAQYILAIIQESHSLYYQVRRKNYRREFPLRLCSRKKERVGSKCGVNDFRLLLGQMKLPNGAAFGLVFIEGLIMNFGPFSSHRSFRLQVCNKL